MEPPPVHPVSESVGFLQDTRGNKALFFLANPNTILSSPLPRLEVGAFLVDGGCGYETLPIAHLAVCYTGALSAFQLDTHRSKVEHCLLQ